MDKATYESRYGELEIQFYKLLSEQTLLEIAAENRFGKEIRALEEDAVKKI